MKSVPQQRVVDDAEDEPVPQFPHANCVAVEVMASVLQSAFGPQSHDKLVVDQSVSRAEQENPGVTPTDEVVVTGDGATILEALPVQHPVAPIVRRLLGPERPGDTAVVGKDIPDGVTGTVVLTGALLDEALSLIDDGLHPHDVRQGYAIALETALETLADETRLLSSFDDVRAVEQAVARSAMTGNDVGGLAETWAPLVVDAVDTIERPREDTFAVRCFSTGELRDSRLVQGSILDRNSRANDEMPRRVEDATVLLLDGHTTGGLMDPEWNEDATLDLTSTSFGDVESLYAAQRREVVDHYRSLGVDVVVTRLGINKSYQKLLAKAGILGVRGVNRIEMQQLARATGATLVKNPTDVVAEDLGYAGVVYETQTDPRRGRRKNRYMVVFDDCREPASVAVAVHGVSDQIADQVTTEVRKAAAAVAAARGAGGFQPGVVPGAGAVEIRMATAVRTRAKAVDTRAQLAVDAFADALERVVATLVRNGGQNGLDVLPDLHAAHARGTTDAGFVLPAATVQSATEAGVFDPVAYKRRMLVAATEVSDLILRVDDAIDATFTTEPIGPDDAIYDDRAENHLDHIEENPGTRWDQ